MKVRNVRWPEECEAIAEHIRQVHGDDDLELLMRWYGGFPGFDSADCFVIEGEQGEIAAHTMLISRSLQIGDALLPAGEIGIVGTLEAYRGRGYARTLMERALERMRERGDIVSLLFGIANFYEQWGYEYAVGTYLTSYESEIDTERALRAGQWDMSHGHNRRTAAYLGVTKRPVTVRRFYLSDLPAVKRLYIAESMRGHYLVARDDRMWEWQLQFMTDSGRNDPDDFLVAEVDNELVGYIRVVSKVPVNWFMGDAAARFSIIECAGTHADATDALLATAAGLARDYGLARIGVFVHPASRLMRHVIALGGVRRDFTGAGFLRLNDLSGLMELIAPTLARRLKNSPFAGQDYILNVRTPHDSTEVSLGNGGETVRLELHETDLIRLVTGWFGVDDLPPDYYSEHQRQVLQVMFPKGEPRIGLADLL